MGRFVVNAFMECWSERMTVICRGIPGRLRADFASPPACKCWMGQDVVSPGGKTWGIIRNVFPLWPRHRTVSTVRRRGWTGGRMPFLSGTGGAISSHRSWVGSKGDGHGDEISIHHVGPADRDSQPPASDFHGVCVERCQGAQARSVGATGKTLLTTTENAPAQCRGPWKPVPSPWRKITGGRSNPAGSPSPL